MTFDTGDIFNLSLHPIKLNLLLSGEAPAIRALMTELEPEMELQEVAYQSRRIFFF